MSTIAITNQKGGVGKTTTVINLAGALAAAGKKVLAIDLDAQANLTAGLGVKVGDLKASTADLLTGRSTYEKTLLKQVSPGIDLLPSSIDLASTETELFNTISRETVLRGLLEGKTAKYDYVVIDCPPNLGLLTINGLCAADEAIIPTQAHLYSIKGLQNLVQVVEMIRARINPKLKIMGLLPTFVDTRTVLGREMLDQLSNLGQPVFATHIKNAVKLAEAPLAGKTIQVYAPESDAAAMYRGLATEVLHASA
jgi:chromosome partitioning protein